MKFQAGNLPGWQLAQWLLLLPWKENDSQEIQLFPLAQLLFVPSQWKN